MGVMVTMVRALVMSMSECGGEETNSNSNDESNKDGDTAAAAGDGSDAAGDAELVMTRNTRVQGKDSPSMNTRSLFRNPSQGDTQVMEGT